MVLGKLPVPGRPTILITVGQGPIALAVCADGGGLDIFTLIYLFSSFSLSLGDGSIYTEILSQRAVKPKTNQPTKIQFAAYVKHAKSTCMFSAASQAIQSEIFPYHFDLP